MQYFAKNTPSLFMQVVAISGLVIAVGFTRVVDYDLFWHIITGEIIWRWKWIPTYDFFSYTAQGVQWSNHEWLYQLLVWALFNNFGIAAFTFLKLTLTICITVISYKTIRLLTSSNGVALLGTTLMLVALADRITDRPHIISLFAVGFFCLELHRFIAGDKKTIIILPIAQVVWINLHGAGIMGPEIVLACAAGETLQAVLNGPSPLGRDRIRHLWVIGAACVAACVINPLGIDLIIFCVRHINMQNILAFTQEWLPVFDPRLDGVVSQIIFRTILVAVLISFIYNRRGVRLSHLMLTILSSALIFKGRRFTAEFVVIVLPILFANLKPPLTLPSPLRGEGKDENCIYKWAVIVAITALSIFSLKNGIPATIHGGIANEFGLGVTEQFAPVRMINFLDKNGIHGRVFNEMGVGGYLIFSRWPHDLVFIDSRTPVYGDDFYREYIDSFRLPKNFEEMDRRYRFDYLVFKADQAWEVRGLHKYLWEGKTWKLVYINPAEGLVYLRNEPKFRELIKRLEVKQNPLIEEMEKDIEKNL